MPKEGLGITFVPKIFIKRNAKGFIADIIDIKELYQRNAGKVLAKKKKGLLTAPADFRNDRVRVFT